MTVHVGTTVGRTERDAARGRYAPAVAAARVVSIDYKPIVEGAVAGLGQSTPDARREVYAQAKAVVKRHLQLMRLPDPIVEIEKLALDLTIKGIEKRIRVHQSVEDAIREGMAKGDRRPGSFAEAVAALATALTSLGRAFASLTVALCLRPVFRALWILLWPLRAVLRALFSPVGLAATLPVAAMAVFVGFFVDYDIAYHSLADGPAARWLPRLEELIAVPKPRPPAASRERLQAALEPSGDAGPVLPPSLAKPPSLLSPASGGTGASPTSRGVTKVRPVRADFAAPSANRAAEDVEAPPPPDETSVCDDVRSAAERISCARAFGMGQVATAAAQAPPQSGSNRPSPLVAGYPAAANLGTPSFRAPPERSEAGTMAVTSIEATAVRSPQGPAVEDQAPAAPIAAPSDGPGSTLPSPDAAMTPPPPPPPAPRATAPESEPVTAATEAATGAAAAPAPAGPASTADGKVAALMESGRAAARAGDFDRAVRDFGEAIKLDAKYPDSYAERGQALFRMGAIDRAIADFTAAIQRNGEHVGALRARGIAYFRHGAPDPALADINRAILLAGMKPGHLSPVDLFEALRYRIAIYAVKQQFDLAIADATAIIDTYGRDPSLAAALKASYGEVGAGDAVAAVYRDRATAYVRAPAVSLGWKRRLNLDRAVEDLSAAIPLSSDRGFAVLLERAKLNEDLGRHDPAVADAKTALGIKPDSEEARSALRRLGLSPPPLPNAAPAAAAPAIPVPRPRPALQLPAAG
jgi:tetratricopeptide (TPR) repeat protein